jgi:hypothetical protein
MKKAAQTNVVLPIFFIYTRARLFALFIVLTRVDYQQYFIEIICICDFQM